MPSVECCWEEDEGAVLMLMPREARLREIEAIFVATASPPLDSSMVVVVVVELRAAERDDRRPP